MRRHILAIALMIAAGIPGATAAGECGFVNCWGAVGLGPNGARGFSFGQYSEARAVIQLQEECGGDCDTIKTFYNSCGAMAQGDGGGWGFGIASNASQAAHHALGYCSNYGGGCTVEAWACSP